MLVGPSGQAIKTESKAEEQPKEDAEAAKEAAPEQGMPDKPFIGIDQMGNLSMFVPLHRVDEIWARGFADKCATEIRGWYARQAQKQREISALAAKTGYRRFVDKVLRRK